MKTTDGHKLEFMGSKERIWTGLGEGGDYGTKEENEIATAEASLESVVNLQQSWEGHSDLFWLFSDESTWQ